MSDVFAKAELLAVDTYCLSCEEDLSVAADKLLANFESLFPAFTDQERAVVMNNCVPIFNELRESNRITLFAVAVAFATSINGVLNARLVSRQQGH